MAGKEKSNSSKTAHVMNLLSKNRPTESAGEASAESAQAGKPRVEKKAAVVPPLITSLASDASVSLIIKSALEESLEAELEGQQEDAAAPSLPGKSAPHAEESSVEVPRKAPPEPVQAEVPVEAVVPNTAHTVSEAPVSEAKDADKTTCVNVMQVLVEESAERYIKMFGLCQCPRCITDVKALALNNLQPKYVVMNEREMVPRITVYEGKFSSAVTAQILRACAVVRDQPRH